MRGRVLLLMLALAAPAVPAQVYRWVDAQGRVQLSDRPPPGVEAQRVVEKPQSHKPVNADAEQRRLQEQQDRWQQNLRAPVEPAPPREPERRHRRPPPGSDACTQARYRFEGSRDGRLAYCSRRTGHCEKVDANDLALLEREVKEACQRR